MGHKNSTLAETKQPSYGTRFITPEPEVNFNLPRRWTKTYQVPEPYQQTPIKPDHNISIPNIAPRSPRQPRARSPVKIRD